MWGPSHRIGSALDRVRSSVACADWIVVLSRLDRRRRTDQGEVAEGLREVAHLSLARDVVFLGKQAKVVAQRD
jgi:hypothetical protein